MRHNRSVRSPLAALCDIATARAKQGDPQRALELVSAVIAHPFSDQHQRYNPRSIREIADEQRTQLLEAGATTAPTAPPPNFETVVASLLEGSESIRAAS